MDSITRQKLKQLVQSQHWESIYVFKSLIIDAWNREEIKHPDEFNTMWSMAIKQGKIEGLQEFLDGIEKIALDEN